MIALVFLLKTVGLFALYAMLMGDLKNTKKV